jgi:hypothetical protein
LQTKRLTTFEKQDGDEMEELMARPAKKSRHQKYEEPTKVLSGIVITRLRRKLNWKYHILKTQLLLENSPVISKEDWLKDQKTEEVENFVEVELAARCQAAISYLHQWLRVLQDRKLKYDGLLVSLRKCVYTTQSYTKIREATTEEDKSLIDLTEDQPKFTLESVTKAQLNRVTIQCLVVLNMLQEISLKNAKETSILKSFMSDFQSLPSNLVARENMLKDHEILKKQFRRDHMMNILSERVRSFTGSVISAKKIREWYHEYLDKQSFEEDLRGTWKREMFLEEYGYSLRFQIYLKNEKKLTVDAATKELELIIQRDPPKSEEGRKAFDNLRPFCQ